MRLDEYGKMEMTMTERRLYNEEYVKEMARLRAREDYEDNRLKRMERIRTGIPEEKECEKEDFATLAEEVKTMLIEKIFDGGDQNDSE